MYGSSYTNTQCLPAKANQPKMLGSSFYVGAPLSAKVPKLKPGTVLLLSKKWEVFKVSAKVKTQHRPSFVKKKLEFFKSVFFRQKKWEVFKISAKKPGIVVL